MRRLLCLIAFCALAFSLHTSLHAAEKAKATAPKAVGKATPAIPADVVQLGDAVPRHFGNRSGLRRRRLGFLGGVKRRVK